MVYHLVLFNSEHSEEDVRRVLAVAEAKLPGIPGVGSCRGLWGVDPAGRYRYALFMTFQRPDQVEPYRKHPVHQAFVAEHFGPLTSERLVLDFEPA